MRVRVGEVGGGGGHNGHMKSSANTLSRFTLSQDYHPRTIFTTHANARKPHSQPSPELQQITLSLSLSLSLTLIIFTTHAHTHLISSVCSIVRFFSKVGGGDGAKLASHKPATVLRVIPHQSLYRRLNLDTRCT
jgi:hypothetical protein